MESIFPKEMLNSELTLESIISNLIYFQEQLHLQHWQTVVYAQHKSLGDLYEFIEGFKDEIVEKIIGYTNKRPGVPKLLPLSDCKPLEVVEKGIVFSKSLKNYAEKNNYLDIGNMADTLSGEFAKTKYLLTLQ